MSIGYSVGERIYAFVGGVEWFQVSPSTVVQYKLNVKYEKKNLHENSRDYFNLRYCYLFADVCLPHFSFILRSICYHYN